MESKERRTNILNGIILAICACLVWSGNFIIARGVSHIIPPVTLAFFRWMVATIVLLPFAWKRVMEQRHIIAKHAFYLFWCALTGVALFNTFVYIAGHYIEAVNLTLIGTTSSPIFSIVLARIFLKEKISVPRVLGLAICILAIIILISRGNVDTLLALRFSIGDGWILLAAFWFACYNVLVRKKPAELSPLVFVAVIFCLGTFILLPFFIWEHNTLPAVKMDRSFLLIILYLGIGTSAIAYSCWNAAIARLGTARTSLFGNLIPLFASIEAVIILKEKMTTVHYVGILLVIIGLIIANRNAAKR